MGEFTTFRVLPRGRSWGVKEDGTPHPQSFHASRTDAVRRAKAVAHLLRPSRVVIHTPRGEVEAVFSYHYWIGPANSNGSDLDADIQWIGRRDERHASPEPRRRRVAGREQRSARTA